MLAHGTLHADPPTWKAGTARARITPTESLWLAGYAGRDHAAEGTLHDLWIKVLALEDAAGGRVVIVTSDLLNIPKVMADTVTTEAQQRFDLNRSQIMLTCSHTHTGPVLEESLSCIYPLDDEQMRMIMAYSQELKKTIITTIGEALSRMSPASLSAGQGVATFAVNRRNNSEKQVIELREKGMPLKGPVDHSLPVLAVRSPAGTLQAIVFGYACHATTLSSYRWSGDYPGFAQIAVEKAHPEALAMFWQGCGADQNPLPRRTVELCEKYGHMLADGVEAVLREPMKPIAPRLQTAFEQVTLPFAEAPELKDLQTMAKRSDYNGRWARRLIDRLDKGRPWETSYPYPVQVWRLGEDQLWISLGGEVVVDYALRFKRELGETIWVTGYANDVMAYIPSRRVWDEGGYESGAFTVYDLPANGWAGDIEQRVTATVGRLVQNVSK